MTHSPLLLQLVVILGAARLLGLVLRFFGQPPVIGEMAAGVVLGPIVFGALAPELHAHIFDKSSLGALSSLSQLGLVLFMFIVGAELRLPMGVRKQLAAASWIGAVVRRDSHGAWSAASPRRCTRRSPRQASTFWPFALFMASAMSITAFPVMARILKERRADGHDDRPSVAHRRRRRRRSCLDHAGAGGRTRRQRSGLESICQDARGSRDACRDHLCSA